MPISEAEALGPTATARKRKADETGFIESALAGVVTGVINIPKGFHIKPNNSSTEENVLKVHNNVYGQCQDRRVWYKYLANKLMNELHFKRSKVDECIFYRGETIYMLYTDDTILAGPNISEINTVVLDLRNAGLNVTDEGDIKDFLGVNIVKKKDGTIHLTQPHLIDQILKDLNLDQ